MRGTPGVWRRLTRFWEESAQLHRWIAFTFVGLLGVLVQLSALALLTGALGVHYLLGTGLAVEAAVLHNFVWHERWTWSDLSGHDRKGLWKRLLRFHLANGAPSIGGNLALMSLLVGAWSVNYAPASVLSITVCSLLNFFASDRLVFQGTPLGHRKTW